MTINTLDRNLTEAQNLLDTLRIEFKSCGVEVFDCIADLVDDKINFHQFEVARDYFKMSFGWEIARVDGYFFMVKTMPKKVIYIEVELA